MYALSMQHKTVLLKTNKKLLNLPHLAVSSDCWSPVYSLLTAITDEHIIGVHTDNLHCDYADCMDILENHPNRP